MSTPSTVITQLQSELLLVDNVTGIADTNIHDAIAHLIAIPGTIGGKRFDRGSVIFAQGTTNSMTVNHRLGALPSAAFLWVVDAPFAIDGTNLPTYCNGAARTDATSADNCIIFIIASASQRAASGINSSYNHVTWTNSGITFSVSTASPFRAGLTYQWLAIA